MSEKTENKKARELNEYDVTPDGIVTEKEMKESGYIKEEVYPLRYFRAKLLYDMGLPIFMLYPDNTERQAKNRQELGDHDWLYGIPKLAWQEFLNTEEAIGFIRAVNHVAAEIQEESPEEYYKTMRPYIVSLVTEFSCMIWAWFEGSELGKIPRSEIFLKLCERIAYDTDNYIFGSRD